ncbi:gephyrin-like molybdotransferase Glp [Mesorhizobium sp. CO1-1-8]|uniref:molybdopterin molybdotransferase MoeA n=1 Tax=Mesorhizobium sp. CO1-1-8 TaxID=2876631 RepID=UPI001CD10E1A|nr:gephyrin-like molybdotransferase Glp [Mesorhizobium sp. CO1-1-8]MBZ9772428.1 molybdopterin molybdotransferase MoeA [Mesorhizobium sp. CO1-1-8]
MTVAKAREHIASTYLRVTGPERLPLHACVGRYLADDVIAASNIPAFDIAAMDGYAVRSADLDIEGRACLRVISEIAAGHPGDKHVNAGEAAHIFTGALVPPGADRVIPQEDCVRRPANVSVAGQVGGKLHIRRRGEDIAAGQTVLRAGRRLSPGQIALLTALSFDAVVVRRNLRVALLSTGDELADVSNSPKAGGIVDSNRPMLRGWLEQLGCEVDDLGIIPDSSDLLLQTLIKAAAVSDLIITSGGASVGPADHLARTIASHGSVQFWKLNMRPGKPVALGSIGCCPVLALPGNPFAAATAFRLVGQFLIGCLVGDAGSGAAPLTLPFGALSLQSGKPSAGPCGQIYHHAIGADGC